MYFTTQHDPRNFGRTDSLLKEQMKNDCVVNQYIKVFFVYMYIKENIILYGAVSTPNRVRSVAVRGMSRGEGFLSLRCSSKEKL